MKWVRRGIEWFCVVCVFLTIMNPIRMVLWMQTFDTMAMSVEMFYYRYIARFFGGGNAKRDSR